MKIHIKELIVVTLLAFLVGQGLKAQKYAYVDSEYILENIPEYKDAQDQLDELSAQYQKEIEDKYAEIDKMYKTYQAEAVLMPEDVKKKKEDEITAREKEVKDLQNQRFGTDGDLFQKREELIKPIQEKIYNSIETIATDKNYVFVFDKAGSPTLLYANSKFDISDDVLDDVGAVLGTVRREDRVKPQYEPPPEEKNKENNQRTSPNNSKPGNRPAGPGGSNTGPIKKVERK